MKNFIITKWIEPYRLLETIKKYYQCKDFTFDGLNKIEKKNEFVKQLNNSNNHNAIGLYMKNVNKFYLFLSDDNFDIVNELVKLFNFSSEDYLITEDFEKPFLMIDMGKAEAGIIIP